MLCSSSSSELAEVSVDEVSDPSIDDQGLPLRKGRLRRLSQTARNTCKASSRLPHAPNTEMESKEEWTVFPEGGCVICTFIPNILPMTVDVLHCDSQP